MGSCIPCSEEGKSSTKKTNKNINNDNNTKLIRAKDKNKFDDEKKIEKPKHFDKPISKDINKISIKNEEELITVFFKEEDDYEKLFIPCNNLYFFSSIEKKLYKEHPYLKGINMREKNSKMSKVFNNLKKLFGDIKIYNDYDLNLLIGNNHICFYVFGIKVDKSKTLKENNIKDDDVILLKYSDFNLININFILDAPEINYKISCYDIYLFSTIEQKLYYEYPELDGKNIIFQLEGNKIIKSLTLEENNIKNNDIISMKIIDGEKINVTFISIDQNTNCPMSCFDSEFFCDVEEKLYKKAPELQNEYYFMCNGGVVDKFLTFAQNKIIDLNIILIAEVNPEEDLSNKLIAIIVRSVDQRTNCAIPCYLKDNFSMIEEKFFLKYPNLKKEEIFFIFGGNILDKSKTLKENGLSNGSVIVCLME